MRGTRLPARPVEGEIRVQHVRTGTDGGGIRAFGPSRLRPYALGIFNDRSLAFPVDHRAQENRPAELRWLERRRSPLEELEAAGYDPDTLVFSILPRGATRDGATTGAAHADRLEQALAALSGLSDALERLHGAKGVYLLDEGERNDLVTAAAVAQAAVRADLGSTDATSVSDAAAREGTDGAAHVAEAAPEGTPSPVGAPPRLGPGSFEKVMLLSWENDSDEDEVNLTLKDKDETVGTVFGEVGGGEYRWRCPPTDWRGTERTLQEAKDNLVMQYAGFREREARDLLVRAERRLREAGLDPTG